MSDNAISQSIATFFAVIMLFIFIVAIKYFKVGVRILLIKFKVIRKEDDRSYTEMVGYGIGKLIGKISNRKKIESGK